MTDWEKFGIGCVVAALFVVLTGIERALREAVKQLEIIRYRLEQRDKRPPHI